MNRTLIEKLQNNDAHRIFGDMTPEEWQCLKDVGYKNREYLVADYVHMWWTQDRLESLCFNSIYRIKADYQLKPEYVDLPISQFVTFRTQHDDCVQLSDVATLLAAGHEVVARFRRDET